MEKTVLAETVPSGNAPLAGPAPAPPDSLRARSLHFTGSVPGFDSELDAHVQDRLRIGTGFMGVASLALFLVGRITFAIYAGRIAFELGHPSVITHLVSCVVALGCWWFLGRGPLRGADLFRMDFLVAESSILAAVLIHGFSYETGILQVVPLLGLFVIARAVVVPSRATRTFWLSLPAMPGILLVQAAHGRAFGYGGQELREEAYTSYVLWDQAILGFSVAVATLASRVNFSLRLRAWEAKQVDRYTLEERIGVGAMGEVYRARHGLMRRPTAIKVLRPEIAGERNLARFEQEVRQTARLTHPNTIAIYDYGLTDEGDFYYAMELLDGADLDRVVAATGPLPPARVIHVLLQACGSLAEAHGMGLVHRDVKPANIVLCRRGGETDVAKVMDFGLVKDTREEGGAGEEGLAGTPLTMAPEMVLRRPLTPAADLYSLGAVGHYLLTGRPLFDADTAGAFMMMHLRVVPPAPSSRVAGVPPDLEAVLMRCLAKDPADRPPSAAALREDLRRCADAGKWTDADARRWWEENGGRVGAGAGAEPATA